IGNRGGNAGVNFRTGIYLTPDFQLPPHKVCALAHSLQAPMSRAPVSENLRGYTLPVIPHPQPQLILFIFYPLPHAPLLSVVECIAQRLARNPIDVITQDRIEATRRALDRNMEQRSILAGLLGCKLLAESLNRYSEIVGDDCR